MTTWGHRLGWLVARKDLPRNAAARPRPVSTQLLAVAASVLLAFAGLYPKPLSAREITLRAIEARRWLTFPPAAEHRVTAALTLKGTTPQRVLLEGGELVLLRDDARISLPTQYTTLLYVDGRGAMQYATSPIDGSTEILWLGGNGRLEHQEKIALGLLPLVALSVDGSSLFAGSGIPPVDSPLERKAQIFSSEQLMVAFTPGGKQLWQRTLDPTRAVVLVATASRSAHSVAVTADREDLLDDHRLETFDSGGKPRGKSEPLTEIGQRLALVADQPLLWVQTSAGHALYQLGPAGPDRLWHEADRRCIGSAGSAAVDPGSRYLFLIDRDCDDEPPFRWRLSVLDLTNGRTLQSSSLDAAPSSDNTTEPIRPAVADWIEVGEGNVRSAVGDYFYVWSWSERP